MTVIKPNITSVDIQAEGDRVIVLHNGRLLWDMDWQAAAIFARALAIKSKEAEEIAKAQQIIYDSAILLRAGVPLGLSNNRSIQREAAKEAAWNSDLRRYMPDGIRSQEMVGTPAIIKEAVDNNV
jgi:hypothetical protein